MDDDEVDAGQFEPIAQMRRLAVVLPKVLEPFDRIPVKLYLPEPLDPDLFSELLAEQGESTSKHESVKKEKDLLLLKATKNDPDKDETKEREEREQEKEEINKEIRSSRKDIERKESERKESEIKEEEKREPEKKASERKEAERKAQEKKELEKKEFEKQEREKKTMKTKEHDTDVETDKKDYKEERAHERKEAIPKDRKDHLLSKESSGKQSYWSESETSSFSSIASQLSLRPGRNMRATPLSRASSRNTSLNDPHVDLDPGKTYSHRARKVLPMEGSDSSYHHGQKKVKDKDREMVDQLVEGRKMEDRREGHRYHIKSMINDVYRRKQNRIAACSSDLDHPSANRGFPTEPRPQSTLSHRSIRSGQANNLPKHHHHRSKRSDATSHRHGNDDSRRRSADWVRSQQVGRRVQSSNPLTSGGRGSDDVVNVIAIITEEFKRLGFL